MEISVIIPVYNNGSTLEACVASVTRQAFQPLEILLVDDGSPEGTAEAEKLEREESRVRLLRHEHGGVAYARNRGLQEARGEWILFLDADDRMAEMEVGKHRQRRPLLLRRQVRHRHGQADDPREAGLDPAAAEGGGQHGQRPQHQQDNGCARVFHARNISFGTKIAT